MKIRTKLTIFFTLVIIILMLAAFLTVFNSLKNYMYRLLEHRMNRLIENFDRDYKLDNINNYEEIKKIEFVIPPPPDFNKEKDNKKTDQFIPIPFPDEKHESKDKGKKKLFFIWFAVYDENFDVINSTDLAQDYPIKLTLNNAKKKYFILEFKNVENNHLFTVNEKNYSYIIAKSYSRKTADKKDFYLLTVMPFTEEIDYINELIIIIIRLVIIVFVIIFIFGFFYAWYSLNPMNKIIAQLNEISDKDLSRRILVKNKKDEIAELSNSINNLLKRIESAFLMEKQFVSDVSHEFKTPLSFLRLSLENLINDKSISDKNLITLGQNIETIYSMDILIQKLLYLSKLEQNIIPFKPEIFSLKEIVDSIIKNLQFIAENKSINISSMINNNYYFKGDKDLFYVALYNIVENALKYTKKGLINISITNCDDITIISVEDTGSGISKDKIDKIFDKFYRIDKSRKFNEGYGLGLTIAKRIIDIHNGKIEVISEAGKGSVFKIIL